MKQKGAMDKGVKNGGRLYPVAIINFILTLFISFVLVETFYHRNLKPQLRKNFTVIGIADQLYMQLAVLGSNAPWVTLVSGPSP